MHVRVNVYNRICSYFCLRAFVLQGKLAYYRRVRRGIVFSEKPYVTAEAHCKHFRYLEMQI